MAEVFATTLRKSAVATTAVAVIGLVAVCIVPLLPVWPCVLLEHFRVQYALAACAAALRMRGYFDAATLATLAQLVWIAPDLTRAATPAPVDGIPVRLLVLNVHTSSSSYAAVQTLIDEERPDVVALVEVDQRWLDALAPSLRDYVGRLEEPREDNFGVALYTRHTLVGSSLRLGSSLPTVVAETRFGNAALGIVVVHTLPPISADALDAQRAHLDAVASHARSLATPLVVVGDLNATPWSRPFQQLVARSALCDSRAGFGVQASFPAASALLRIPIDHVLTSCSIGVTDRRVTRDVGSDHLPVVVDLVIPRAQPDVRVTPESATR